MKTNKLIQFWSILLACLMAFGVGKVWGNTTVSSSSFSSLSGNIQSDANISYSTGNGDATTATAIDGTSIKLYRSTGTNAGGILLLTANNGVKIKSFTITFTGVLGYRSAANTTTAAKTSYTSLTSGTAVSNLDLSSVQIGNIATTKTQAFVSEISVTYATACDKSVTVSSGSSSTNGSISTITGSPVATCDASASNRTVTITVSPNTGYVAPTNLSFSVTSGNAVTATKQSGPTNNVYVYSFAQNDNNSTCKVNVACVGKQCTLIFDQNSGTGGQTSNLTATYGSAMPAISGVPTREHYDFEGYYDGAGGTGNKYYNSDGTSATNWNKNTTANTTLYAKWTEHSLTNYRTSCCTELGVIDGKATLTQGGNSVTISGWSDVSNVGTYTVKLYKKNGASWDLVSGTTSGGSAGAQGTRTGIASGSKSVTYTGLEVESEYKFTVQAIAGSAAYCDGVETAVTEINSTDVSSTPFKFRYSIYIDNGSNSGWAHHYIEPTGNTDEGSVDITLAGPVDYYQFKIGGGFSGWWGQTGESKYTTGGTQWTLDGSQNVKMQTWIGGTYTFTVDYSGTTNPKVTITYPSANQDAGNIVYWDASVVANWDHLHFRVGTDGNANAGSDCKTDLQKVPGTDNFYKVTTASFTGMRVWAIANNTGWTGSNTNGVYKTNTGDDYAVTLSSDYQDYVVEEDGVTLVPYGSGAMGSYSHDNNCRFYTVTKTDGMLTHNVSLNSPAHGTLLVTYTNTSGTTGQTVTEGNNADLAHRCILTITATPDDGYTCTSLTVNSSNFTSGNTHILSADAIVEATFTAKSCTVNFDKNSGTGGDASTTATYGSAMTTVTAPTRTGYTFDGYWDAETDNDGSGTQYYLANGTSARNWDKDVTAAQTLYAKWNAKQYTIELDREGASTGAESVIATFDSGTLTDWSAPTKTGYTFGGYYSGDNGTGTLVISTAGVLQNSVTISAVNWTDASGHWIKDGGVTLYAKWTADEYTISYKDQGNVDYSGSNLASLPTSHTYGAATDLVDGVRSGYRFDGWFDNSTCTGSAITSIGATAITANTTYYAKWTAVYTVTWHVNGSTYNTGVVTGNSQVPNGEQISTMPTAPADNTLNNCASKFMGWSAKDAGSTAKTTSYYDDLFTDVEGSPTISDDIDFYAVFAERNGAAVNTVMWSENWTGVTSGKKPSEYDGTGRTIYNGGTVTYTESGSNCNIAANSYAGGSSPELYIKGGEWWNIANIPTGGATTLTLTYMSNNDADVTTSTKNVAVGTTSSSGNARTRTITISGDVSNFDLKFAKSSNTRVDNVSVKVATSSYDDYVTECASNQVRVTYDFNGGTGTACSEGVTIKNASFSVCSTTPTKNYYDFGGWNDGTSSYAAGATGYDLQSNTTFTAQWTPTTYSITYENMDGATNPIENVASYTVETSTITLGTPTRGHDRFDGWYDNGSFTGDAVTSIPNGSHGDITLYAKWAERHHIEFFKEGVRVGEIWRADDENMEDAVAGQGTAPVEPIAPPTTCSSKVFVGWTEDPIDDETDDAPADLMKPAAGTVDEDKEFHAVWAIEESETGTVTVFEDALNISGTDAVTSRSGWSTISYVEANSGDGVKLSSKKNPATMTVDLSSKSLASTLIITFQVKQYSDESGYIAFDCLDDGTTASFSPSSISSITDATWTNKTCTVTTVNAATQHITINGQANARVYMRNFKITQTGTVYNYSAYSTSCCATNVTLSHNSPSNGTIVFGKTKVPTCGDKEVSLTISPEAGYQLHSYEVATGGGKVATKSVSPAIALDNNSNAAQNITLTFADEANGAYDVTASFTEMTVTSWTWTNHEGGGAIPNPLNLYVGQSARVDVAYNPSSVLSSHKNYSRSKDDTYINWPGGAQPSAYCTFIGKASTGENTTTITLTHSDAALEQLVYVKVLPLPLTHFVDLVHGKPFADVAATIEANALSATKTTPTSDDWTTPNANECESDHLHLVGWIREDWPALVAYLNGTGDAPTTTAIVGAGNDDAGHAYYIAAGASINVHTFDGVTFYAVWAEIK